MKTLSPEEQVPAWPPDDYKGTMADWLVALETRGIEWGDYISQEIWWEILEECEA